jgi:hypothetical protein
LFLVLKSFPSYFKTIKAQNIPKITPASTSDGSINPILFINNFKEFLWEKTEDGVYSPILKLNKKI